MRKLIVAATAALLLSGCAGAPEEGTVVEKRYTPASSENECKGTGKKRTCKIDYDPEVCEYRIRNGEEEGWVQVSCLAYDSYKLNDWYVS